MSGITIVMVVRDEEYFLPLSLGNALEHADNVFVLDTGSKDKTINVLRYFQSAFPDKLMYAQRDFGGRYPFDNGAIANCRREASDPGTGAYREMEARNYALERAEELFEPDWILRMDADEAFDEQLFNVMRNETEKTCVGFSCDLPVFNNPLCINRSPSDLSNWGGAILHDPHIFAWRIGCNVRWVHPANSHVALQGHGYGLGHARIITDPVHFHFHRCFGPKSIYTFLYWSKMHEAKRLGIALNIPYGGVEMFNDVPGINRENMYTTQAYRDHMPNLFDVSGRFIVPKIVTEEFAKHRLEIGKTLSPVIMNAWNNFLVY